MERAERWIGRGAILLLAFAAGWLASGGRTVQAQASAPQMDVRTVATESSIVVYYADQKTLYVYASPFVAGPYPPCMYKFTLGEPGKPLTREQCPASGN